MNRLAAVFLVILLAIAVGMGMLMLPASAEAEGKFHTAVIENIELSLGGMEPVVFGFRAELQAGVRGEDTGARFILEGGKNRIVDSRMALIDGEMHLGLEGIANNYAVAPGQLNNMLADAMGNAGISEMEMSGLLATEHIGDYLRDLWLGTAQEREAIAPEAFPGLFAAAGLTETGQEEVEICGNKTVATRYEMDVKMSESDALIELLYEDMLGVRGFTLFDAQVGMLSGPMNGGTEQIDPDRPHASLYEIDGFEMEYSLVVWYNEYTGGLRFETGNTVLTRHGEPLGESGPMVVERSLDELGMVVTDVRIATTPGQQERYVVKRIGADTNAHRVEYSINTGEWGIASGARVAFDLTTTVGETPAELFDEGGKPTLDAGDLSLQQLGELSQELNTFGIIATGKIMQTEGVAKFMSMQWSPEIAGGSAS